jgi:hypothetical protein
VKKWMVLQGLSTHNNSWEKKNMDTETYGTAVPGASAPPIATEAERMSLDQAMNQFVNEQRRYAAQYSLALTPDQIRLSEQIAAVDMTAVLDEWAPPVPVPSLAEQAAEAEKQKVKLSKQEIESYITYLTGQLKLDYAKVTALKPDIEKAFSVEGKTGVNKMLMGNEALQKTTESIAISEDALATVMEFDKKWASDQVSRRIRDLQQKIDRSISNAQNYYREANGYLRGIRADQAELHQLEGRTSDPDILKTQVQALAAKGFALDISQAEQGSLNFITPPITLSQFNTEAGLNYSVVMGNYKIKVLMPHCTVQVFEAANNIRVRGYYHPHVAVDGNICWGNAANAVTQAVVTRDVQKLVELAFAVLSEYNDESPYKHLNQFWQMSNPEYLNTLEKVWVKDTSACWAIEEDLPADPHSGDIRDTSNDSYDRAMIRFYPYILQYKGTGIEVERDGETQYAIRAGNNRYVTVDHDVAQEWEW